MLRALWSGNSSFHGKYYNFDDAVFEPKPVSKNLEIWIGGTSTAAMKRAATLGDAWHPNVYPLEQFKKMVSNFREISRSDMKIRVRIALNLNTSKSEITGPQGEKRLILSRDMERNRETIRGLEKLGIDYALVVTSSDGMVERKDQLESLRMFASTFHK
jgi:hypothetical protein